MINNPLNSLNKIKSCVDIHPQNNLKGPTDRELQPESCSIEEYLKLSSKMDTLNSKGGYSRCPLTGKSEIITNGLQRTWRVHCRKAINQAPALSYST